VHQPVDCQYQRTHGPQYPLRAASPEHRFRARHLADATVRPPVQQEAWRSRNRTDGNGGGRRSARPSREGAVLSRAGRSPRPASDPCTVSWGRRDGWWRRRSNTHALHPPTAHPPTTQRSCGGTVRAKGSRRAAGGSGRLARGSGGTGSRRRARSVGWRERSTRVGRVCSAMEGDRHPGAALRTRPHWEVASPTLGATPRGMSRGPLRQTARVP
jgi:hypothetical protein